MLQLHTLFVRFVASDGKYEAFECALKNEEAFSTADSSCASLLRLFFFFFNSVLFLGKGPVLPLVLIFMNPSLPAHKSSLHRKVSISLEVIQGTIMNQTQRHNLFRPHLIGALFSFFFF